MFHKFLLFCFILISVNASAQNKVNIKHLKAPYATEERQKAFLANLQSTLNNLYNNDKAFKKVDEWTELLKDLDLIFYKDSLLQKSLANILSQSNSISPMLITAALESTYTSYPNEFVNAITAINSRTISSTQFMISTLYLTRLNLKSTDEIKASLSEKFPNWEDNPRLKMFEYNLTTPKNEQLKNIPSLKALLNGEYQQEKTILFSFQRANRNYPGITIIRKPNGEFLRNDDSSLFYIPQLALSSSNLPGYINNGNTPQGIYSVVGWYITPTESIGPTPIVLVRSPWEITPNIFYHKQNKSARWNEEEYKSLLPGKWQSYTPIMEAFNAHRKLIIMHGSADNVEYFTGKPYYPLTPSKGCLTSKELWDSQTGKCIESHQAKLINAFFSTGQTKGFLVVVDIDDKEIPVSVKEIESLIGH